jgi:hypothetical protein
VLKITVACCLLVQHENLLLNEMSISDGCQKKHKQIVVGSEDSHL